MGKREENWQKYLDLFVREEGMNSMCRDCLTHCQGTKNQLYTGCVHKTQDLDFTDFQKAWNNYQMAKNLTNLAKKEMDEYPYNDAISEKFAIAAVREQSTHHSAVLAFCRFTGVDQKSAYLELARRELEINNIFHA
ncbi:MAG: hypothetical protein MR218_08450 [Eubacterium sp.]|nr:hypothetical protein [Eubacterium sp.]